MSAFTSDNETETYNNLLAIIVGGESTDGSEMFIFQVCLQRLEAKSLCGFCQTRTMDRTTGSISFL